VAVRVGHYDPQHALRSEKIGTLSDREGWLASIALDLVPTDCGLDCITRIVALADNYIRRKYAYFPTDVLPAVLEE
jgi:hypothetical protein